MPRRFLSLFLVTAGLGLVLATAPPAAAGHCGRSYGHLHGHHRYHGIHFYGHSRQTYDWRRQYRSGTSIWRHHGLGNGYYRSAGVRRHHGLGENLTWPAPAQRGRTGYRWAPDSGGPAIGPPATNGARVPEPNGEPTYSRVRRAWDLLSAGRARDARREFAILALNSPQDARPKAGFALATALLGNHETAMWAMRRAMQLDAASLQELTIDQRLARQIRGLIARNDYEQVAGAEPSVDSLFMAAALHYLLRDADAARAAITAAIQRGDTDASTKALMDRLRHGRDRGESRLDGRRTPDGSAFGGTILRIRCTRIASAPT